MTTVRTGPELRDEAKRRIARRLAHEQQLERPTPPDLLAAELLICLDGIHIALVDTTPTTDPAADPFTRPNPADPDSPARAQFRAARAALKDQQ